MEASTVAKASAELQSSGRAASAAMDALSDKLNAAARAGDARAKAWQLDLREVALSAREEASLAASLVNIVGLGNPEIAHRNSSALADRAAQTETLLTRLSAKVKAAADLGDDEAREWHLDLREAALSIREQSRLATDLADAAASPAQDLGRSPYAQQRPASPDAGPYAPYGQQQYAQPSYYQGQPQYQQDQPRYQNQPQQGGFFNRLMGSGFGQAMAMGAGFAVGEEVVDSVFDDIF